MEKRVLITGVNGFLGSRLFEYFKEQEGYDVLGVTHGEPEVSDSLVVTAFINVIRSDYVLHCAGVSDTGICEAEPELSEQINVRGTANMAKACRQSNTRMVFMSSDQIYNASCSMEPNREGRVQRSCTVYGRDKKRAEEAMFACLSDAVALRLTWMYDYPIRERTGDTGLLGNLVSAPEENRRMKLPVYDYRGITYVWNAVRGMTRALMLPGGIYNFGSENTMNTCDMAVLFLQALTGREDVPAWAEPDRERFAASPRNLTIDIGRVNSHGIGFEDTVAGIRTCLSDYRGRWRLGMDLYTPAMIQDERTGNQ